MAKRSTRIQQLRERNELSCMWGLFSIIESCQGHPRRKLISNGRRVNEHVIADNPRKLDQPASFDEECRRIQSEACLRGVAVDARAKMDTEDRVVKTQRKARKSSENPRHSSSCRLNSETSLINQLPSTSAEKSLKNLTLAAILDAVCAQNHQEESKLFENIGKCDQVNEINFQQVQMRAKAFINQMYADRKFICKEGTKSFSNALEVLSSNSGLLKSEKETVKSVLGRNFSECEGLNASSSAESQSALVRQRGNINKNSGQKSDKIVILKPVPRHSKHSEDVICHCSSLHSHSKSGRKVSDAKSSSFSFREMKRKLKHTFGGTSNELSQERSTLRVGDECISGGVETRHSFDSSTSAEQNRKPRKKQDLKSNNRVSGSACLNDSARKKVDLSRVEFSNKRDFDVILEAKRHLSARLNNLNSLEAATGNRSPKTLGRILSSPEHDFRPLSPRRDSQYFSGSAQMRFCPYNTSPRATESSSQMPNVRERADLSPLRSNIESTSCDDCKNHGLLQLTDAKTRSPIPSTEEEVLNSDISTTDNVKSNGDQPKTLEMNNISQPDSHISEEVSSDMKNNKIKSPKEDEIVMHSILDSLSENEAISSAVDDFPSTPLSIYQLDTADSIKYQEHRSPVSVLEPFFIEYADSPPSISLQTAKKQLQPRRLHFEECSFESIPQDPSTNSNPCIQEEEEEEEDHISQYVQLVLQASCLNWHLLSQMRSPPEELLHASLFDEVEFPPVDCYYDPKLLFDHINEVLLEIYKSHFRSPPWLALAKPRIGSVSLVELVLDEIMRDAEFYLLPTTERRTLDQLVSKDVMKCRSWLDVRLSTEQVVFEISEDVLDESILDIVLDFCI